MKGDDRGEGLVTEGRVCLATRLGLEHRAIPGSWGPTTHPLKGGAERYTTMFQESQRVQQETHLWGPWRGELCMHRLMAPG